MSKRTRPSTGLRLIGLGAIVFVASFFGGMAIAANVTNEEKVSHADFAAYVAQALETFPEMEIGASCADWPDLTADQTSELVVLPAASGDSNTCLVLGWSYSNALPVDLPDDMILWEGALGRHPIFDGYGQVIGHFDSPEMSAGSLDPAQLDGLPISPAIAD